MQPTDELIDELERDKIEAARRMSPGEKILAGPRLFDLACEFALADLRRRHAGASPAKLIELLRERLRIGREIEDTSWKPKRSLSRS